MELTDAALRALRPPAEGRLEVWDTLVNGLILRLTASDDASWCVRARTADGKRTRPNIGSWPEMGIKAARRQARVVLGHIAAGQDPASEKRTARARHRARAGLPAVAARLSEWRQNRAAMWSERYAAEVERLCRNFVEPVLEPTPPRPSPQSVPYATFHGAYEPLERPDHCRQVHRSEVPAAAF
jgi:hypothetical protein